MQNASRTPHEAEININDLSELDTVDELVARYPDKFTKAQIQWQLTFSQSLRYDQPRPRAGFLVGNEFV